MVVLLAQLSLECARASVQRPLTYFQRCLILNIIRLAHGLIRLEGQSAPIEDARLETATAMKQTMLKQIPSSQFLVERRPLGNPVVEGLAAHEERFRNPRCSQCSHDARLQIYTAGPVVVCTDPVCNKVERVDVETLQRLAKSLRVTCRKCNRTGLASLRGEGPLGNYLKCRNCGENTLWQFVAGYVRRD